MIEDLRDEFKSDSKVYEKKYVDSDLNKKLNNELRESGFTSMYELKNDFGYSVRCFKDILILILMIKRLMNLNFMRKNLWI